MKVIFTKHAIKRFKDFRKQGVWITRQQVTGTLKDPDHVDKESDETKIIASKRKDSTHILRVVFKLEDDIITVITFYVAKRGRYYEDEKN